MRADAKKCVREVERERERERESERRQKTRKGEQEAQIDGSKTFKFKAKQQNE
jgi:hypothetical protein